MSGRVIVGSVGRDFSLLKRAGLTPLSQRSLSFRFMQLGGEDKDERVSTHPRSEGLAIVGL